VDVYGKNGNASKNMGIHCKKGKEFVTETTDEKPKRRGVVADALRRQGIDPDKVKKNDCEVNVLSGRRFEEDFCKGVCDRND
jgi:hypothetical protein